jgi:hypothetical protein
MVNVVLGLQVFMLIAGFGGFLNGLLMYGGLVVPRWVKRTITIGSQGNEKKVPVNTLMLGVFGSILFGFGVGVVMFMYHQWDVPISQNFDSFPRGRESLIVFCWGLAGTALFDYLLDKYQKAVQNPTLEAADPEKAAAVKKFKRAPLALMSFTNTHSANG